MRRLIAMVGSAPVVRTDGVWCFDRNNCSAAVARPDGSVDIFDVSAGARVIERVSGVPSTSGRPSTLAIASKRERTSYLVATGTTGGQLSVGTNAVSLLDGEKVAALEFCEAGLLACGAAEKHVLLLNPDSGKLVRRYETGRDHCAALNALAISSDGKRFAVCSQTISLGEVDSGKRLQSLAGHVAPISTVKFFANDSRLITGSANEQYLYIWDVSPKYASKTVTEDISASGKKKRKRKSSLSRSFHTLIAPERGVRRVEVHETSVGTVSIAALLKSGTVAVWANWSATDTQSSKSSFILYPCAEDSDYDAPSVHGVLFADDDNLAVVYGNTLKPQVMKVNVRTSTGSLYLPKPSSSNLLISHTSPLRDGQVAGIGPNAADAANAEANAPEAVAKSAMGAAKLASTAEPPTRRRKREKKKAIKANGVANGIRSAGGEDLGAGSSSEDEDDVVDAEPTLSEKLKALGVSESTRSTPFQGKVVSEPYHEAGMDSRAEVIMQGLNTNDERLLNSVIFSELNYDVVVSTVRKLPANIATGQLLNVLDVKMRDKPRQTGLVLPWIQAVLCEHATSLISQPKSDAFRNLMDTVILRNDTLDGLNKLEGRLELIVSQTTRTSAWNKKNLSKAVPQLEYIEKSGEKEDDEHMQDEENEEEESSEESDNSEDESDEDEDETVTRMELSMANGRMHSEKQSTKVNGRKHEDENVDNSDSEDA